VEVEIGESTERSVRALAARLRLFRFKSKRLELLAPFSRQIAEPLDADAAGQATFNGSFDKTRRSPQRGEGDTSSRVEDHRVPLLSAAFRDTRPGRRARRRS
jgi:hypothetical protein